MASGLCDLCRVAVVSRRDCLLEPEWGPLVQVGLKSRVGVQPFRDFRQNLLSCVDPCPGAETHAFEMPDRGDEIADRDCKHLRQSFEGTCSRDDRTAFNLSESYP